MRILHFIPVYAPAWKFGGPVRSVSALCEGLAVRGHEVTVLTTDAGLESIPKLPRGEVVMRNGVKVLYYRQVLGYGICSPTLVGAIAAAAKDFDLVHISAVWQRTGPAAAQAALSAAIPYVVSPRGALGPYSWQHGRLKKLLYYFLRERHTLRHAAAFHYTTEMERDECAPFRFGRPGCVVPNPIDFSHWRRDEVAGAKCRQRYGVTHGEVFALYAGRVHHNKGLELLAEVMRLTHLRNVPCKLLLAGPEEDGTADVLRIRFAQHGLSDRVQFAATLSSDELRAAYSAADVFLLPSLHDSFGNVAVEAAGCGCWVLASVFTGVARQIAALNAGECLPLEAEAWADAIARSRGRKVDAAIISDVFSVDRTAQVMERFYETVVSEAGRKQRHA